MAKLTLQEVGAGYSASTDLNANNALLEAAVENTLSRDGTSPNQMLANFDMNSYRVINMADGINPQDGVTVSQMNGAITAEYIFDQIVLDGSITLAKLENVATSKLLGRATAGTGTVEHIDFTSFTEDTTPDSDVDLVLTWDDSASLFKKVKMKNQSVGIPQNAQTGNYTIAMTDNGRHIYHAAGAGAGDVYTINSNANLALPIGFTVTFVNLATDSVSIAITTDTMYLAGSGSTGSRTLAQYGIATALKVDTTTWVISGTGLS